MQCSQFSGSGHTLTKWRPVVLIIIKLNYTLLRTVNNDADLNQNTNKNKMGGNFFHLVELSASVFNHRTTAKDGSQVFVVSVELAVPVLPSHFVISDKWTWTQSSRLYHNNPSTTTTEGMKVRSPHFFWVGDANEVRCSTHSLFLEYDVYDDKLQPWSWLWLWR